MRLDHATFALVPRSTADCLDMAVMFYGRHLFSIAQLCCWVALPCGAAAYYLARFEEFNILVALPIVFVGTSPLGLLLITTTAASAFGEPFRFRDSLRRFGWRAPWDLIEGFGIQVLTILGLMLCLFPGLWFAARTGFRIEQSTLSRLEKHLHDRRTSDLVASQIGELMIRICWIAAFCALTFIVLFVTTDWFGSILFGFPNMFAAMVDDTADPMMVLRSDPLRIVLATVVGLFVFPIGRLAWFFCYIDLRVRLDLWDMELRFLQEKRRLENAW